MLKTAAPRVAQRSLGILLWCYGGVVLAIDVDAGIVFLHFFVGKQLRKGSEEFFNLWVLVQDLGADNRGKVVLRKERIRVCP